MADTQMVVKTNVRGMSMQLVAHTRALELCARMNRETEVLDFIDGIPLGGVFYDLGACEGRFALYAALRNIRCYAFEPESMNFAAMLANIELNGEKAKTLITPLNLAVGDRSRSANLKIGQPWAGGHQKVVDGESGRLDLAFDFISEQTIQVVAIDEFISSTGSRPPDFLKVDVDGSEMAFIKGSAKTLERRELKGIMFELHERDASYNQVVSLLGSFGFVIADRFEVEPALFNIWFCRLE
jgi:FkbM family methyltransferase